MSLSTPIAIRMTSFKDRTDKKGPEALLWHFTRPFQIVDGSAKLKWTTRLSECQLSHQVGSGEGELTLLEAIFQYVQRVMQSYCMLVDRHSRPRVVNASVKQKPV